MLLEAELSDQKIFFGCLFRGLRTIYPVALTTAVDQHHWTTLRCRSHVPHVPPIVSPFCVGAFSGLVGKRIGVSMPLFSSRNSHSLHFPAIIGVIVADNPGENFVVSERECGQSAEVLGQYPPICGQSLRFICDAPADPLFNRANRS